MYYTNSLYFSLDYGFIKYPVLVSRTVPEMDTNSSFTSSSSSSSSSSEDQETKPSHVDKFLMVHPVVQTRRTFMAGWSCSRVLIATYIIAVFFFEVQAEVNGPCMGCRLFNEHHRHHPEKDRKDTAFCHFPCQCRVEELSCQDGVSEIKDGCGCCYMCARQMGDMCSVRDVCDTAKNLYCDRKDDNSTGLCKGRDKNPCLVDGVTYKDGEKFQPECSQLCTCQNGFYGCINTCPQELQKPSELTCHEPKLIQVKNKCCKEWSCQKMEASGMAGLAQDRGLHSDNLILQNPMWYQTSTSPSLVEPAALSTASFKTCDKKTTDWTPCSVTCDVGVSIRITVYPSTCHSLQELRLCYLRPCGTSLDTLGRGKCTPTTRSGRRYHIRYQDCISLKDYNLKFCTSCKRDKCCYPFKTRRRIMEFQCSDGKRELYDYMWVKRCRCERTCDPRQNRQQNKGRNRRAGEDNQRRRRYK